MASYVKSGGKVRAFVRRKGSTAISKTFSTMGRARAWADRVETEIADGLEGAIPNKPFSAVLERYRDTVSVTKRGEKWESLRIGATLHDTLAQVNLRDITTTHVAEWRDRRLQAVSAGSVLREWTLLSHACTVAVKEWRWLKVNPFRGVKRPPEPPHREATYTDDQIARLQHALGEDPATATGRTGLAFRFALETAMRAGEICGLTWPLVDLDRRVARLAMTKNGTAREVPLSSEACRILQLLPAGDTVFGLTVQQLDALFRKGKARAMIEGMHFHDSRSTAIMRLSKRLDILDLARMVGHRDLKMLLVYYRARAEDIAKKL